jgi:hypothetical protein
VPKLAGAWPAASMFGCLSLSLHARQGRRHDHELTRVLVLFE